MLHFTMVCYVCFLQTFLTCCHENFTVTHFSVPEDHHVCLRCAGSDRSRVVWTHQDSRVPVNKQGDYDTNEEPQRHLLLSDGGLCVLHVDDSDSGDYRCNQRLVAELQVLTGRDFVVSAGRTLLLPCRHSSRPRQRWFHRRRGGRRELIFTRFRNRTVQPERDGRRLSFDNDALQIQDLQPEDAGEYQCNGEPQGRVTIVTDHPETTSVHSLSTLRPSSAVANTALSMLTVSALGLMVVVMTTVCVVLSSVSCRKKSKQRHAGAGQRHEDTVSSTETGHKLSRVSTEWEESETETPVSHAMIHYASLGRHNWTPADQDQDQDRVQDRVIYSSIITTAAV